MKYFKAYELVDKETYEQRGENALEVFNPETLIQLDNLREFFSAPITVNNWHFGGNFQWRGWRTPEVAADLGAPNSQHVIGNAIDCDIKGIIADIARELIITHKNDPLLSRINRLEDGVNWVHFDLMYVTNRIHLFKK